MTAEGDNSVLMQKVAKERLTALAKSGQLKLPAAPAAKDLANRVSFLFYTDIVNYICKFLFVNDKNCLLITAKVDLSHRLQKTVFLKGGLAETLRLRY
jgi:hypothetical protein